jgi:hypothetical protein
MPSAGWSGQSGLVLALGQCPGDAAHPGAPLGPILRRELVLGHHIGDPDPAARLEHAEGLSEHGRLVGREVDHTVGDHDVHGPSWERDGLDLALEELDVAGAGFAGVAAGRNFLYILKAGPAGRRASAGKLTRCPPSTSKALCRPSGSDASGRHRGQAGGRVTA